MPIAQDDGLGCPGRVRTTRLSTLYPRRYLALGTAKEKSPYGRRFIQRVSYYILLQFMYKRVASSSFIEPGYSFPFLAELSTVQSVPSQQRLGLYLLTINLDWLERVSRGVIVLLGVTGSLVRRLVCALVIQARLDVCESLGKLLQLSLQS